jgi:transposase
MRHVGERTREEEIAYCEQQSHFHAQQYLYYTHKLNDLRQQAQRAGGRQGDGAAETDVSDEQWNLISPLLRDKKHFGRPMADPRQVLNGILYVQKHHCAWNKMPKRYGSYVTCWRREFHWRAQGVWQKIEEVLMSALLTSPPPTSLGAYGDVPQHHRR